MQKASFDDNFLADDARAAPSVDGTKYLINGEIRQWEGQMADVYSPIFRKGNPEKIRLGQYAMLDKATALEALDAADAAYKNGRGKWCLMPDKERIECVEKYLTGLIAKRDEIVSLIEWEICKNKAAAAKEVDRTIVYIKDTILQMKKMVNSDSNFTRVEGILAQVRRAPYGTVLCCGPFNYPFNETYTVLIPALLMGNCVVVKLPRTGVLCHYPTLELFRDCFPPGVVNVISGSGRTTMPPIMETGKIDIFGFIGTSTAAADLQKCHPAPHRLRVVLGLEAKNPAIVLDDAPLDVAVKEITAGSFGFNGQRCTAIKIVWVADAVYDKFVSMFTESVDNLVMGTPWDDKVEITPLPEAGKPDYLDKLVADAVEKGAKVANKRGGQMDRTLVAPTVLTGVTPEMRIYREEQFGPLVPVIKFSDLETVLDYFATSQYGQQASVFSTNKNGAFASVLDSLVNQVCRVNLNTQCQRGPDVLPFTGRKDSAYGTLSVWDALRTFSIRSMVATKDDDDNRGVVQKIVEGNSSNFLRMEYLF
eukprot:TRINITY_DN66907_c13_g2_i1.p1 TRINITY_DN66907_c13_g2~~TRINITY_DN66907_c13_g2_i1.p1  ORF type:complete len:535 (-),score=83.29 TRINITY_DN66907_c13_g2_i1:1597-3201(-)